MVDPNLIVREANFESEYKIRMWKSHFSGLPPPRTLGLSIGAVPMRRLQLVLSFNHLQSLSVDDGAWKRMRKPISLFHLHGLSPTLKTLHFTRHSSSISKLFNFINSFPQLENLLLDVRVPFERDDTGAHLTPLAAQTLNGYLVLKMKKGKIAPIIRNLLKIPEGLRFSTIELACPAETGPEVRDLVLECSDTLEYLHIEYTTGIVPKSPLPPFRSADRSSSPPHRSSSSVAATTEDRSLQSHKTQ